MRVLDAFKANLDRWRGAFKQTRTFERATRVLVALLASHGRSTLTNSITYRGKEQADWSADYKVFNRSEWRTRDLFREVLLEGLQALSKDAPVVVAMDDTTLPKVGTKIPQARWCHDPLAPKFLDKQIQWGIRMLHAALLIPDDQSHRPLAISTAFEPIPAAPKAKVWGPITAAEHAKREARKKEASLTTRSVDLIRAMRKTLDDAGETARKLLLVVDGSFTNGAVVCHLPKGTELIGRTRKNAKLYAPLAEKDGKRIYGEALPTPEAMRQDKLIPKQVARLHYGGALREIAFKEVSRVLWKDGTKGKLMRLLIVMPIPYTVPGRKKRGYNAPAYLLTTDLETPASELLQAYLDRWQIEVLHRDLKTGLGVGQVQAFAEASNEKVHGAQVAAFSMLNLAAYKVRNGKDSGAMPQPPLWRKGKPPMRMSLHDLISRLRNDLQASGHFETSTAQMPKGWTLNHRETYQAA